MVHRALLGSLERFFGVLLEHHGGSFPLWLAPVQVAVVPISQNFFGYAEEIEKELKKQGIRVTLDRRNEKIGYKIRDWETNKVPYMLILGEKEQTQGLVSVRKHKEGDKGSVKLNDLIEELKNKIENKLNNN